MKTAKECTTCMHHSKFIEEHPCNVCVANDTLSCGFEKWEPIETKKMKNETPKRIIEALKEIFTFSDSVNLFAARVTSIVVIPYLCFIAISAIGSEITTSNYTFGGMVSGLLITIGIWLLGYFSRRSHPNEKSFLMWLKICILKLRIAILKKSLKPYPTLNKIKHRKYSAIRATVKA